MMTPRQRVLNTVRHQEPDRVPFRAAPSGRTGSAGGLGESADQGLLRGVAT
jgi:hypothetical protein